MHATARANNLANRIAAALALGFALCAAAWSQTRFDAERATIDFRPDAAQPALLPWWVADDGANPGRAFATRTLRVTPPGDADLLVTACFDDRPAGFVRLFWVSDRVQMTVADNLAEGIGMPDQRTILVPGDELRGPGSLVFQSGTEDPAVSRVALEWVRHAPVLVSGAAPAPALVAPDGRGVAREELAAAPQPPPKDTWRGDVVTACIASDPERIEAGVAFVADLAERPMATRATMWVAGLGLDDALYLWVNGTFRGLATPEVPAVDDPGMTPDQDGAWAFAGWRRASVFLPDGTLQGGVNRVQFSRASGDAAPLAVKDLRLEMRFPPAPAEALPDVPDPAGPIGPKPPEPDPIRPPPPDLPPAAPLPDAPPTPQADAWPGEPPAAEVVAMPEDVAQPAPEPEEISAPEAPLNAPLRPDEDEGISLRGHRR